MCKVDTEMAWLSCAVWRDSVISSRTKIGLDASGRERPPHLSTVILQDSRVFASGRGVRFRAFCLSTS